MSNGTFVPSLVERAEGEKPFLTLEEAGALLGVKRGRAWELARAGLLPAVRLGRRWYVPRKALERLADEALARALAALERQC